MNNSTTDACGWPQLHCPICHYDYPSGTQHSCPTNTLTLTPNGCQKCQQQSQKKYCPHCGKELQ